jgi:hypothetical protein
MIHDYENDNFLIKQFITITKQQQEITTDHQTMQTTTNISFLITFNNHHNLK